jgi:hypothetical protein
MEDEAMMAEIGGSIAGNNLYHSAKDVDLLVNSY